MMEIAVGIVLWLFYLPLFYLTGSLFSKYCRADSCLMEGVIKTSLGIGVVGYLVIFLGSLGLLKVIPIYGILLFLFLLRIRHFPSFLVWLLESVSFLFLSRAAWFVWCLRFIFGVSVAMCLIVCFTPEIANDSLAYHLALPKMWIKNSSVLPYIFDEKSYRSLFMEQLFCIPMLVNNIPAAILFHCVTGLLLVLAVTHYWFQKTQQYAISLFLSVLLWLTPTVFNQIANSYTDASVALFVFLSFYLFENALRGEHKSLFLMSGLMMGVGVSCKLLALLVGFSMGCWGIVRLFEVKERRRYLLNGLLLFAFGTLLTCGYWYIRNYLMEGDPLYPLFTKKFGTAGLYQEQKFSEIGVPKTLLSYLLLPVLTAFQPDPFNRYHWVGPLYLFLFPIMIFSVFKNKDARGPLFVGWLTATCWFLLAQDIRFLFPAFALALTSTAYGLSSLSNVAFVNKKQRLIQLSALIALLFYLALGGYHYRIQLLSFFQQWGRANYLTRLERSYPMAAWMNENLPKDAKVFNAIEVRTFYFDHEMIDSSMFLRLNPDVYEMTPEQYLQRLKSMGITHILHTRLYTIPPDEQLKNPKFKNLLSVLSLSTAVEPVKTITSENIREDRHIYTLYKIL